MRGERLLERGQLHRAVSANPPPTIALSSPADGAVYIAPASGSLNASVTANGHTISQVQFYDYGALIARPPLRPIAGRYTT